MNSGSSLSSGGLRRSLLLEEVDGALRQSLGTGKLVENRRELVGFLLDVVAVVDRARGHMKRKEPRHWRDLLHDVDGCSFYEVSGGYLYLALELQGSSEMSWWLF